MTNEELLEQIYQTMDKRLTLLSSQIITTVNQMIDQQSEDFGNHFDKPLKSLERNIANIQPFSNKEMQDTVDAWEHDLSRIKDLLSEMQQRVKLLEEHSIT